MKPVALFLAFVYSIIPAEAREYLQSYESLDVKHYDIYLHINDTSNTINGLTGISVLYKYPVEEVNFDLASKDKEGTGMVVDSVLKNGSKIEFFHQENNLRMPVSNVDSGQLARFEVFYHGTVNEGLIISKNMYGDRTFFADNWPNRAHNWFPCIDHPSERSLVDFTITAPSHYQVIATGTLKKKVNLPGKRTAHHWSSSIPIPTKVMVFAAAGFAVEYPGDIDGIPYSNWVYPQNMGEGFHDFAVTPDILRFFTEMIGPYPFEKIANVQSTTRFGGMENAGNIFYHEAAVTGDRSIKYTIVHEIAHQWFGNSVTEADWAHLWLSEGIATWLTDLYIEDIYGADKLTERFDSHRRRIIEYSKERLAPVVITHTDNYTDLLNPNTYQKGAWILHMLRGKIGKETLIEGLVEFYNRYSLGNACTDKFISVIEEVSGIDLDEFADDWLYSAGHPVISLNTGFKNDRLIMELVQVQQHKMAFTFPLNIKLVFEDGTDISHKFDIMFRRHEFILEVPSEPVEVVLDPEVWLLFEQI
jgi:aminopeptidase N